MLKKIKQSVGRHLINIPGWRTDRKIVVIESDDWGSIRMPSRDIYKKLLSARIRVDKSLYDRYDTLENKRDLELLFDTISNYKDSNGKHPVFTLYTVVGNPAFDLIKADNFEKYYYEDFLKSYEVYHGEDLSGIWYNALEKGIIKPQFHAREHLNVSLWMEALKKNYKDTRLAFDNKYFALKTKTPSDKQHNYLAAYWPENETDLKDKVEILKEGLEIFSKIFGFESKSFVACNYIYSAEMEKSLATHGVKYIHTQRGHLSPDAVTGERKIRRHYTGQNNNFNQIYLVRNCFFEPALDADSKTVDRCLREIRSAFLWKKPAIVSTHRINYVGGMSTKNREKSLRKLNELLSQIIIQWPEVEFMSSDELGNIIEREI